MANKLVDDQRIVSYSAGVPVTPTAFLNELQDQLRGCLKTLEMDVTGLFITPPAPGWGFIGGGSTMYWNSSTANSWVLAPLPLREGQKITQLDITANGNSATGGTVELQKRQIITGTGNPSFGTYAQIAGTNITNPWNTGVANFDRLTVSSLSVIVETGYTYRVAVQKANDAVATAFGNVVLTVQLGN